MVNARKEYLLHNNLGPEDLVYQYTNVSPTLQPWKISFAPAAVSLTTTQIGWTLWNISIHALFIGAAVILYDGSPFLPTPAGFLKALFKFKYSSYALGLLWHMNADRSRITSFGAGPRYYAELQKANVKPSQSPTSAWIGFVGIG